MPRLIVFIALAIAVACGGGKGAGSAGAGDGGRPVGPDPKLVRPGEIHLGAVRQLTRGDGENAEAYWSSDGRELIFQTKRPPYECDQIMRVPADGSAEPKLVSTGTGRTTCAFFFPGDQRVLWSSTHLADKQCPPSPDMSKGYVWALYPSYDIFASRPDGSAITQLTKTPGYDAEATICAKDGSIVFTSTRDGDIELYRMDADGKNVRRLTSTPGYDGGAFFSADCSQIVWRASRPTGKELEDFKALLAQDLVRPSKLELFVANADGSDARQVTYLGAASFAPYFHPSGKRILFSSNHGDPKGREFDIWAIDVTGANLERITHSPGFDGFPMFSPDGKQLVFASNRNHARDQETDLYVADWVDRAPEQIEKSTADTFLDDVKWLADDARQGRGVGTEGLAESARWLGAELEQLGVEGGGDGGNYLQELQVAVAVTSGAGTELSIGRQKVAAGDFVPAGFSSTGKASARTVFVGHGIVAKELGVDDYKGKNVKGKIAVVRRYVPETKAFADDTAKRRYSDLHYKAFTARERGARALIIVDAPEVAKGAESPEEAPLPKLDLARQKEVGIPVVLVKRAVGARLTTASSPVVVGVQLDRVMRPAHNVVGVVRAGAATRLPGAIVVGAHYDHLGLGGESSLEPDKQAPHNGADDNASGTAGLLEVARRLVARKAELTRDVYLVAFTAEETGLLGSSHFVNHLPGKLKIEDVVAMINMDMIGRLRQNTVAALGGGTATEWPELVGPACAAARIHCTLDGSGYGPSDQTPFYAGGVPVLHFFTGAHGDYHKTTDDWEHINAGGGAQVAIAVAEVALRVSAHGKTLSYQKVVAPPPPGDTRSYGASLGTIPDYAADESRPGVALSGVRPGGPAEKAGIKAKDRLLKIGDTEVRTVQDLVYVLRQAKPGQKTRVVLERDGKTIEVEVTYGESARR